MNLDIINNFFINEIEKKEIIKILNSKKIKQNKKNLRKEILLLRDIFYRIKYSNKINNYINILNILENLIEQRKLIFNKIK